MLCMLAEKIHIIEPNLFQSEVVKMYGPGGIRTRDLQLRRLPPNPG